MQKSQQEYVPNNITVEYCVAIIKSQQVIRNPGNNSHSSSFLTEQRAPSVPPKSDTLSSRPLDVFEALGQGDYSDQRTVFLINGSQLPSYVNYFYFLYKLLDTIKYV